ncbi:MAG: hypothetical protein ACOCP4_05330 [Candidatus Woesearchaeota archaeon]
MHEVEHILVDFPESPYVIGMDMQHTKVEMKEPKVAEEVVGYVVE